ncbi:unnamed protein product [Heterobilharzia americana]|nr:unnamed protein product [Heterobilharzia americana]
MVTVRPFTCFDLLKYGNINLDMYTETYSISFYLHYLAKWPEYMRVLESPTLNCFKMTSESFSNVVHSDIEQNVKGCTVPSRKEASIPSSCQRLMGYMMAKSEGHGTDWHGHVTALSVAPEYRRLGLATQLMLELEETSERNAVTTLIYLYVLLIS